MPKYPSWSRIYEKDEIESLPRTRGVIKFYWVTYEYETIQFISMSVNIKRRINQLYYERWWNGVKYSETPDKSRRELLKLKNRLIEYNEPPYNW